MSFSEIKNFKCTYDKKTHVWRIEATLETMTASSFEKLFVRALNEKYKISDVTIIVEEYSLSKSEMKNIATAICMEKIVQ